MPRSVDVYCRVSRVGGREHLISPEEQERDARAFAGRRGLAVGEVFTDIDASGGTLERPQLQRALDRGPEPEHRAASSWPTSRV